MLPVHHKRVDLILVGESSSNADWPLGIVQRVDRTVSALAKFVEDYIGQAESEAILFWNPSLGWPDRVTIERLLDTAGDLWHAGLKLGMAGKPRLIDFVQPTWMLNRDPNVSIEATSWRLSLDACLIKTEVLRQLNFLDQGFENFETACLELGYRYITHGVITRHVPSLLGDGMHFNICESTLADDMLFIKKCFCNKWTVWASMRSIMNGFGNLSDIISFWFRHRVVFCADNNEKVFTHEITEFGFNPESFKVTILIPTLQRYSYLRVLLGQLRHQTIKPYEILIVDQTPLELRDLELAQDFADLSLRILYQNIPGQCSSRNLGLREAKGEYILFLDDDDEVEPNIIELHIRNLTQFGVRVSSGVALVETEGVLPQAFLRLRVSDVFPTNNTMINKSVLELSGLFDLAYEKGQRADGDLGMRIYLCGELMILNPDISVLHHHAGAGGLRAHKARVITRALSRKSPVVWNLPSIWDFYLRMRYFSNLQIRESELHALFATLFMDGSRLKKLVKFTLSLFLVVNTIQNIRSRKRMAIRLFEHYPIIPRIDE